MTDEASADSMRAAATVVASVTVAADAIARPHFTALPPLALYVHIPWCVRKCPYCDFNSHEAPDALPEDAYVDALLADLESALPSIWGRKVGTVFIGGGTPSLFSAPSIDRLLSGRARARSARARRGSHARSESGHVRARRSSPASTPRA